MNLKKWIGILFCCLSFTVSAQDEQAKHRALIQEMLNQLSITDFVMAGWKHRLAGRSKATPESTKFAECVMNAMDRQYVTKQGIDVYMSYFSSEEASEIVDFYRTPSGQKYVKDKMNKLTIKYTGLPTVALSPDITETDNTNIENFLQQTTGGRKLMEVGLTPLEALNLTLRPVISELAKKCK
jgi:hypothetical protein